MLKEQYLFLHVSTLSGVKGGSHYLDIPLNYCVIQVCRGYLCEGGVVRCSTERGVTSVRGGAVLNVIACVD